MGRSKSTYLLCIPVVAVILLFSWLFAVILEHYSGHHNIFNRHQLFSKQEIGPGLYRNNGPPFPSGRYENLLIFLQLSDIHVSKFRYVEEIIPQLEEFCDDYIPMINPDLVLVTGDLTDAKAKNNRYSQQYLEEWISYKKLTKKCRKKFNGSWLDIRGNHDDFGLSDHNSMLNLYKTYGSSHGRYGSSGSYQFILEKKFGKYAFNGIDMTPNPGPRRPFNFFGIIEKEDLDAMNEMAKASQMVNMSVWFGHYPLSAVTTPSQVRDVVQQGIAYLCGHLHTLGGLVPSMYARPVEGHLELEAGDWKENRRYRIVAVDHDIFSFADVTYGELPVILITNPKDARFQASGREAIGRTKNSSHIRFLVFTRSRVRKATVFINDVLICSGSEHVAGSLFVCPWQPEKYLFGLHQIEIHIQDAKGGESSKAMQFSLDDSIPLLDFFPALVMLTNFCVLIKAIYFTVLITFVTGPLLLRHSKPRVYSGRWNAFILPMIPRQIYKFAMHDGLFWPLFYWSIYLAIGPLFVGEMVPGSIGVCFVYGIYTNGYWIPDTLTYTFGTLNILFLNFPLMFHFGGILSAKSQSEDTVNITDQKSNKNLTSWFYELLFVFIIIVQMRFANTIYVCYGLMSFILCPVATWNVLFCMWLKYRVKL